MEIPERIQKGYDEITLSNKRSGSSWGNPQLIQIETPKHANDFFIVKLDSAYNICDSKNVDIFNIHLRKGYIEIYCRVHDTPIFKELKSENSI